MVDKFVSISTKEDVCSEWEELQDLLYKECKGMGFIQALHKIVKLDHLFPCMAKFAAIGLVLPVSTADCERCFSCLKRLKTPLRNRMGQKVLNCLVNIHVKDSQLNNWILKKVLFVLQEENTEKFLHKKLNIVIFLLHTSLESINYNAR